MAALRILLRPRLMLDGEASSRSCRIVLSIEPKYIMIDLKKIGQYVVGSISKLNFDFNVTDGNTYMISNNNSNLLNESDRITKITIATSDDSKTISTNSKIQIFGRKIY